MNTQPEQLLRQLKVLQLQKKDIDMQITEKKMVLEKYYQESIIMSTFSIEGVKATRKRKPEKWEYSDLTNRFRKDMINAIEDKEQQEREEGIATKVETDWTKQPKEPDILNLEFNKKKQQMIDDLYVQLGALSDRYHFSNKKEFSTKEYIVQYDNLKKKITDLEK